VLPPRAEADVPELLLVLGQRALAARRQAHRATPEIGSAHAALGQHAQRHVPVLVREAVAVEGDQEQHHRDRGQARIEAHVGRFQGLAGEIADRHHAVEQGLEFRVQHLARISPSAKKITASCVCAEDFW
jgi:hypothetical protein